MFSDATLMMDTNSTENNGLRFARNFLSDLINRAKTIICVVMLYLYPMNS